MKNKVGDLIELQKQDARVVSCNGCGSLMVWIRPRDLEKGDLVTLKRLGLRMTNMNTLDHVCLDCELKREAAEHEEKTKVNTWFNTPAKEDEDDDYKPSSSSSSHSHDYGSSSSGGFGGFGGFGGGSFSGGGASGGW